MSETEKELKRILSAYILLYNQNMQEALVAYKAKMQKVLETYKSINIQ